MTRELRAELKPRRPFKTRAQEAYLSIQRTAALLEHAFEGALRPSGITATQYNVLRILRGAGPEGLCCSEIGERLVRRVPDVTRLLDRLERMGLIARTRGARDRRYVTTRITPKALSLLDGLEGGIDDIHARQFAGLDEARLATLVELLATLREHD